MRTFISFLLFVCAFSYSFAQTVVVRIPCLAWSVDAVNTQAEQQIDSFLAAGYTVTTVVGMSSAAGDSVKNQLLAIARAEKYAAKYGVSDYSVLSNTWYYTTEKANRCVNIVLERHEQSTPAVINDRTALDSLINTVIDNQIIDSLQTLTVDTLPMASIIVLPSKLDAQYLFNCQPCQAEIRRELISRVMLKESKLNWQSNKMGKQGVENRQIMAKAYQEWAFHKTNLKRCKYVNFRKGKSTTAKAQLVSHKPYKKKSKRVRMKPTRGKSVSGIYRIFPQLSCR